MRKKKIKSKNLVVAWTKLTYSQMHDVCEHRWVHIWSREPRYQTQTQVPLKNCLRRIPREETGRYLDICQSFQFCTLLLLI